MRFLSFMLRRCLLCLDANCPAGFVGPELRVVSSESSASTAEIGRCNRRCCCNPPDFAHTRSLPDMEVLERQTDFVLGPVLETNLRRPIRRYKQAVALFRCTVRKGRPTCRTPRSCRIWLTEWRGCCRSSCPASAYHANAARFVTALRHYDKQLMAVFSRLGASPYYCTMVLSVSKPTGLEGGQALMTGDDRLPGARHLVELRRQIQNGEFAGVFREPQYPGAMLRTLTDGVDVTVIELDPMGLNSEATEGFLGLYRRLGEAFLQCFQKSTDRSAA